MHLQFGSKWAVLIKSWFVSHVALKSHSSKLNCWIIEPFCRWLISQLSIQQNCKNSKFPCTGFCLPFLNIIRTNHNVLLLTQCYIFSHDSVLHYLFLNVSWTLDLWFDVLLPYSQPISPILLNQYVHWRMFTLTDCGWKKSTQTFAGCPFNNPFVYRGWGDAVGLGDTIPISIKGELAKGWGWNRVHIKRLDVNSFTYMSQKSRKLVLKNSFAVGCLCWKSYGHDSLTIKYFTFQIIACN